MQVFLLLFMMVTYAVEGRIKLKYCRSDADCSLSEICLNRRCVDSCDNICGVNARCEVKRTYACMEPQETGESLPSIPEAKTCRIHGDCADNQACQGSRCTDPCPSACGEGAECTTMNHEAVCYCPKESTGHPFEECAASVKKCDHNGNCDMDQVCFKAECIDPCVSACGINALCNVENHKPVCYCPKGYTGHPFEECRPFTQNDENLCEPNPCGTNAECKVRQDSGNNPRAVCTCPAGLIGNPLTSCLGECTDNEDCPDDKVCDENICEDPCSQSPCGSNASCTVVNHERRCLCLPGYRGYPDEACFRFVSRG